MAKKKAESGTPANGQQRPTPAYFLSLSLENVRCFGAKQTLDLSDGSGKPARWTVLLGNNGTGKTTVLQAFVAMYHLLTSPLITTDFLPGPGESRPAPPGFDRFLKRSDQFVTFPRRRDEVATLGATFDELGIESTVHRKAPLHFSTQIGRWLGGIGQSFQPGTGIGPEHELPIVCGYGAGRRLGTGALAPEDQSDACATLFNEPALLLNAEEWLVRLDYSSSKPSPLQQRGKLRLRQVEELLVGVLPDVEAVKYVVEGDVIPTARVEFKTPYGWVPMRQLGYGYQTVIAWMVDLASRMVERYPDSPDPLAEPVIVLVDEIDLHLHPTWQRSLIAKLDERFPRAQFIVTAHSPLVVQAAPNANLAVLRREGDQVVIDNDVDAIRNWRVDQILTSELFGLPTARPPQIEKDLARRAELLQKPRLSARDQKEVEELEARIGPLPGGETPEQRRILQLLERSLDLMEKEQPAKP